MKKLSVLYRLGLEAYESEEEICLPKTYNEGRKCEICNCFLSIYNSSFICWSHQELFWEEKEEYCLYSYKELEDSFSLFSETGGIDEDWSNY